MFDSVKKYAEKALSLHGPLRHRIDRDPAQRAALRALAAIPRAERNEQRKQAWAVADTFYGVSDPSAAGHSLVQIAAALRLSQPVASQTLVQRVQTEEGRRFARLLARVQRQASPWSITWLVPALTGGQAGCILGAGLSICNSCTEFFAPACAYLPPCAGVLAGLALGGLKQRRINAEKASLASIAAAVDTAVNAV